MYLSKILVKGPACRNPYQAHRALWKLFPDDAGANRDFLFRVEHSGRNSVGILMQSIRKPDQLSDTAQVLVCKEYRISLLPHQRLRFLLIANPIKTINDEAGRKSSNGETKKCRVPLIREDEQSAWVSRKFQDAASFENLVVDPVHPLRFRKRKEDNVGKIQPVSFKGTLRVEEPEEMARLIRSGIGPAKAFGCGLLSLARA